MKYMDEVRVIKDKKEYNKEGIYAGRTGWINSCEIRSGSFQVIFIDPRYIDETFEWNDESIYLLAEDVIITMNIEDLEFVSDGGATDEIILSGLPQNDPRWWCKVEDGFIYNLLGEKKNKIAYDYNS